MSKRSTSQRYVAQAIAADGCARRFAVLAESEAEARLRVETFLALHWRDYHVQAVKVTPPKPRDPPVPSRGVGTV